ncbi:MAG: hypothetical protein DDT39_01485 [Firmicutes bacterium]|nr:hypothetical protein [candidate division NPL-UPA2 bacterium]MBT9154806.1 hypothetical protein [candidate division NPL-UPA2 bacterium]
MKLVIAVVQDRDSQRLIDQLINQNLRSTKLASTGGFLKAGNTTLLIGVEDSQMESALGVIRETCKAREQLLTPMAPVGSSAVESYVPYPIEVVVGGATVFVVDVEQFVRF